MDVCLTHYKHLSCYNKWNSSAHLANVVFLLTGTALTWYNNHEDTFTTWDCFEDELKQCFGDCCEEVS